MGYTTNFIGKLKLDRQLSLDDYQWLNDFNEERHEGEKAKGMPGIWCQWVPTKDGWHICWDGGEKFYDYVEWLEWLILNFFLPRGYILDGELEWEGEEQGDVGKILVERNIVKVKKGRIVFDKVYD